ncbi:MAG: WD40 repeat domain-containing protein [Planctomycetes bacterium]|nr:WD40 repeat domain-containing protein [Planctomycetota bacterium]
MKKQPFFFFFVFIVLIGLTIINNLTNEKVTSLIVPDNAGVSVLETVDDSLVCVFKGGQVASWNWSGLPQQQADFSVQTDRVALLDAGRLAAIPEVGKKNLSVYKLPSGEKTKDLSVGWDDQDVWPRISFDKNRVVLIRKNPVDSTGKILYEFLTVDIEKEFLGMPVALSIQAEGEDFIDTAVGGNGILYAVGSKEKKGRIVALDLENGTKVWDTNHDSTLEFCSVIVSPDNQYLLAGNRDGILYKLNTQTGEIVKKIVLLEEGETRPITNDYSVLNLAFSPDGQYFVATINPPVYIIETASDAVVHKFTATNKLVSKIAFSPENGRLATSDIRQSYPVKIWDTTGWLK